MCIETFISLNTILILSWKDFTLRSNPWPMKCSRICSRPSSALVAEGMRRW